MLFIIKMAVKLLQLLLLSREPENHDVHLDAKKNVTKAKLYFHILKYAMNMNSVPF